MKIPLSKAIEIVEINLAEAKRMPADCRTALELGLDAMAGLTAERAIHGYTRIGQLPHEEPQPSKTP